MKWEKTDDVPHIQAHERSATFASAVAMATMNPFEILGDADNDDPAQLLAAASVAKQKAEAKKSAAAATAGKGAQPAPAKLPTKPAPPAQAVRESRSGGAPNRGGFGRGGERGRGRGGRGYGANREFSSEEANGFQGGYGARAGGEEGERGARPPYRGGGFRRGGYRDGEFGDDSERPPRRTYERHSGTGRGYEMKREGAGRGNWGTTTDEVIAQETEEGLKLDEKAPVPEKQGVPEDAPQAENKDNKDAAANEEEEKEEDKEMTLEEFEKIREEKRKALLALKNEERKVEADKDLQAMQQLSTKKGNDEVFIKLGSDKDAKKKENAEREERAKKSLNINEFLKPAEGERYYGGRGRGRGRGERGGFRGGYGGGYRAPPPAPAIQDKSEFPTLGA